MELHKTLYIIFSGDLDAISSVPGHESLSPIKNWADVENLQVLNLKYVPVFT